MRAEPVKAKDLSAGDVVLIKNGRMNSLIRYRITVADGGFIRGHNLQEWDLLNNPEVYVYREVEA